MAGTAEVSAPGMAGPWSESEMDDYRWLEVVVEVEVGVEVGDRVRVEASSGSRWVVVVGGVVWCGVVWMDAEGKGAGRRECRNARMQEVEVVRVG